MYFDYIQMKGFRPKNTRAKMNRQTSGSADPAESKIAALRLCGVTSNEQQKDRRPPHGGGAGNRCKSNLQQGKSTSSRGRRLENISNRKCKWKKPGERKPYT